MLSNDPYFAQIKSFSLLYLMYNILSNNRLGLSQVLGGVAALQLFNIVKQLKL